MEQRTDRILVTHVSLPPPRSIVDGFCAPDLAAIYACKFGLEDDALRTRLSNSYAADPADDHG